MRKRLDVISEWKRIAAEEFSVKKIDLLYYLAGLTEGNGTIYVPKAERDSKGNKAYPGFSIYFHLNNIALAYKIQETLGFGHVYTVKGEQTCVISFGDTCSILTLIHYSNGFFRSPKINSLYALIDFMNNRHNLNIVKKELNRVPLDSHSWLAGFTEADGCFKIKLARGKYISLVFEINQRLVDKSGESCEQFMQEIADFLQVKLKCSRSSGTVDKYHFIITGSNIRTLGIIHSYFSKFSLYGVKFLNYQTFISAYKLMESRRATGSPSQIILYDSCYNLKNSMNNSRSDFTNPQLDNFFKDL